MTSQEFYHDCCSRTLAAIKSAVTALSSEDYPRLNSSTAVPAWDAVRASVLSHLIVDNTPSLPRPSPPWGRGWTAVPMHFIGRRAG